MFSFSAAGLTIPPMIVFPYKRMPNDILESIPEGIKWEKSDSGWMTTEVFYNYIKDIFHPYLVEKEVQFPVILYVDGHKTHLTYSLSKLCDELKIILICLYPNSTRILQPADVSMFKPLKNGWFNEVQRWRRNNLDQKLTKKHFAPILKMVVDAYIREDVIKSGFRACGLYPFDPNAIDYSKCLGNRLTNENPQGFKSQSIDYNRFREIVGSKKIQQLETVDEFDTCTEDFRLLLEIHRNLTNNTNQVTFY